MTEAAHESCGHGAGGPFLSFGSLLNTYEPVACLGQDMPPHLRQACQQSRFEYPYAIAFRGNIRYSNREEREKRLRLLIPGTGDQGSRGKCHRQRGCKADMSFRIRAQVYGMRDGDSVLVAIHPRKFHLVPHTEDIKVATLPVLHVMVHLASFQQREDHKRGRGREGPCELVMVVCGLPCSINGNLLNG